MKKKYFSIVILCLLLCLLFFTSCTLNLNTFQPEINNMRFRLQSVTDKSPEEFKVYEEYYAAGNLLDVTLETYFVPLFVNNIPVLQIGYNESMYSFGSIFTTKDNNIALSTIYFPGTTRRIVCRENYVEEHADNFKAFYCGAVVNLSELARFGVNDKCYVPAEKYEEFANAWVTTHTDRGSAEINLGKANIKYRLNADDMNEYYYVDYVENGASIVNIPPDPERAGYKFDGWYIDKECYTKWNFNSKPILIATESNADGEFSLYAKWVKK